MGHVTKTFNESEQVEITIDQPGRYQIDLRELPDKCKVLLVLTSNKKPAVDVKPRERGE